MRTTDKTSALIRSFLYKIWGILWADAGLHTVSRVLVASADCLCAASTCASSRATSVSAACRSASSFSSACPAAQADQLQAPPLIASDTQLSRVSLRIPGLASCW